MNTEHSSFEQGGFALIYGNPFSYELVQISQINANGLVLNTPIVNVWFDSTAVYPVHLARSDESQKSTRHSSKMIQTPVKFVLEHPCFAYNEASFTEFYLDYPVIEIRNNWTRDVTSDYNRQLETVNFDINSTYFDDESNISTTFIDFNFLLKNQYERTAFIKQMMYLAGKWRAVWLPSGQHDFFLYSNIVLGDSTITVKYSGVSDYGIARTKERIRVLLKTGSVYYFGIAEALNNQDGTETLVLDNVFDISINKDAVLIISYLLPVRLSADAMTLEHITSCVAQCSVTFQTVADIAVDIQAYFYQITLPNGYFIILNHLDSTTFPCTLPDSTYYKTYQNRLLSSNTIMHNVSGAMSYDVDAPTYENTYLYFSPVTRSDNHLFTARVKFNMSSTYLARSNVWNVQYPAQTIISIGYITIAIHPTTGAIGYYIGEWYIQNQPTYLPIMIAWDETYEAAIEQINTTTAVLYLNGVVIATLNVTHLATINLSCGISQSSSANALEMLQRQCLFNEFLFINGLAWANGENYQISNYPYQLP